MLFRSYLQRYVIIVGTAFGGAWTLIVGVMALLGNRAALAAATAGDVWVAYPLSPAPGQRWVLYAWLALSVVGTGVQLGFTAGSKGRIGRRRRSRTMPRPIEDYRVIEFHEGFWDGDQHVFSIWPRFGGEPSAQHGVVDALA